MITFTRKEEKIVAGIVLVGVLNQGIAGLGLAINADKSWDLFSFIFVDLFGIPFLADFSYVLVLVSAVYLSFVYIGLFSKRKKS